MSTNSSDYWDISITDRQGRLVLTVEVRSKVGASAEWASILRRNILAHGIHPRSPYFLMVFPDHFYLWTGKDAGFDQSEPTYTIDARPIFQPYFERAGLAAEKVSGQSLELITESWLASLIYSGKTPDDMNASWSWLVESGLYDALAGGRIQHEAVA